jgi:hypothetical protein
MATMRARSASLSRTGNGAAPFACDASASSLSDAAVDVAAAAAPAAAAAAAASFALARRLAPNRLRAS